MKTLIHACAGLCLAPLWLEATDITTEPIGFNKITCLANSDTIVGVPLRVQGSIRSALGAAPSVNGDSATITLAASALTANALTGHYLKFIDGDRAGRWYDIQTSANSGTPNTANAVTITLNGDTIGNATTGDKVLIAEYWTLDELFPPAEATNSWSGDPPVPNGHAIVASTSRFASGRRTEVLLPNLQGTGTNIAPNEAYYILSSGWRKQGAIYTDDYGTTTLTPDAYFIVRHPSSVTSSTTFRSIGEVETGSFAIPLSTHATLYQDNAVALPRPVDVQLNALGLVPGAFVPSTSRFSSGRKDELLVFNNSTSAFNKAPDRTYYYLNSGWRKQGESYTVDFGTDVIPAGGGFLIRKAPDPAGTTVFWNNPASYTVTP